MTSQNIALIIAGGVGARMHQDTPKQFMHIENKPLIIYTLEAFQAHPSIDAIIVVCLKGWENVLSAYASQYKISKLTSIVPGGENGQASIKNGVHEAARLFSNNSVILIHDANRGLVSQEIISDALSVYAQCGSAVVGIPCTEVVFTKNEQDVATKEIPRHTLVRTQTPQIFSLEKLLWAHQEAAKQNITDSLATCSLMFMLGQEVHFSKGSEKNIKITTQDDVDIFKALLHSER